MKRVLMVCHGNICRSTMAEFVLKKMVADQCLNWEVASAGTSREEIGHDTHYGTKAKLRPALLLPHPHSNGAPFLELLSPEAVS